MKPVSDYEIYINKIKMGTIKNSGDDCRPQTEELEI